MTQTADESTGLDDEDLERRRRWLQRRRDERRSDASPGRWRRGLFRGGSSTGEPARTREWEQRRWTSRALHRVGSVVAHAGAGIAAAVLVAVWTVVGVIEGFPPWWETVLYSVASASTFVMVFVIQHTQARQTAATQRKLDELLRASAQADAGIIAVEEAPDEDLQALTDLNVADRERAAADG